MGRRVVQGWTAKFKLLKIGNEELHNVRLRFADLGTLDTDMLLGADFFVSHRLYVSNLQHRIYFTYTGGRLFNAVAMPTRPPPSSRRTARMPPRPMRKGIAVAARCT